MLSMYEECYGRSLSSCMPLEPLYVEVNMSNWNPYTGGAPSIPPITKGPAYSLMDDPWALAGFFVFLLILVLWGTWLDRY